MYKSKDTKNCKRYTGRESCFLDCLKDTKGLTVRETLNTIIAVEGKSLVNDKARAKQRSLPDLFFIRDMW